MNIISVIQEGVINAVKAVYGADIDSKQVSMNVTRKEFEGDYTVVVFPFSKIARKKPEAIAEDLGKHIVEHVAEISDFNVIKGFLNLSIGSEFWSEFLNAATVDPDFGIHPSNGKKVMVEFSSPNTNKPLHLGHIRNILLGWSCSKILQAAGYEVIKTQIVNNKIGRAHV